MASADFSLRVSTSPFQALGEISPGKNTLLHRTTAGFTPPCLGHKSFAALARSPCLAVPHIRFLFIGSRFTLHASSPRSVTLPQLRFTSFAVASLREDLHLQECAHAGRTKKALAREGWIQVFDGALRSLKNETQGLVMPIRRSSQCLSIMISLASARLAAMTRSSAKTSEGSPCIVSLHP